MSASKHYLLSLRPELHILGFKLIWHGNPRKRFKTKTVPTSPYVYVETAFDSARCVVTALVKVKRRITIICDGYVIDTGDHDVALKAGTYWTGFNLRVRT